MDGRVLIAVVCCWLCLAWAAAADRLSDCPEAKSIPRNISREVCDETAFPYVVALIGSKKIHLCNGVLISPDTIVTTASCFDKKVNDRKLKAFPDALVGSVKAINNIEDFSQSEVLPVCVQVMHPNYTGLLENGSDLAILKLATQQPSNHQIRIFSGKDIDESALRRIARFYICRQIYTSLRIETTLNMISRRECGAALNFTEKFEMQDNILCTAGVASTFQDTAIGGALILDGGSAIEDMLVGISSIDPIKPCDMRMRTPIGFTRVSFFIDWIDEVIHKTKFNPDDVNTNEQECRKFIM